MLKSHTSASSQELISSMRNMLDHDKLVLIPDDFHHKNYNMLR